MTRQSDHLKVLQSQKVSTDCEETKIRLTNEIEALKRKKETTVVKLNKAKAAVDSYSRLHS